MREQRPTTLVCYDHRLMSLEGLVAAFDDDPLVEVVASSTDPNELPRILQLVRPEICLVDVAVANADCIASLAHLARVAPRTAVVLLVDDPTTSFVCKATHVGVRGFARKDATFRSLRKTIDRVATGQGVVGADAFGRIPTPSSRYPSRPAARGTVDQLTEREHEVLNRIMAGDDTLRIAAALQISRSTARTHVQNVRRKLGARTTLQAVALARGTTTSWSAADGYAVSRCG